MSDPQIYVKGFSKNCRQSDLKQQFSKFGQIVQVRLIRDYAFIVFRNKEEIEKAVKQMDGSTFQGGKLRVQVAGRPRKVKGPQPNDQCRYCRRLGHWQNDCPQYRQRSRRRRRSYSSSSSSSSSSSESDRSRRKRRKSKKVKKSRRRSQSSQSSRSSDSSSSRSSSEHKQEKNERRDDKRDEKRDDKREREDKRDKANQENDK